ncbi:hypothetical protein PUN28_015584 [Cardiocondyla obscurior]|uniref:Uncharacterized protein n=1 Tax=Cardiocondyla obscurior TaxID=286306 RepID=A0AAW2EYW7_9HYME
MRLTVKGGHVESPCVSSRQGASKFRINRVRSEKKKYIYISFSLFFSRISDREIYYCKCKFARKRRVLIRRHREVPLQLSLCVSYKLNVQLGRTFINVTTARLQGDVCSQET